MSARRRGRGWLAALLIAGAALVRPLAAQELRGTVRDSTSQQPIPGAVLILLDSTGASVGRGITNDRGQFRVATGPTARQVKVQRIGFRPRLVAVPGNPAAGIDITMIPLPSLLEPIQVSDVTKCSRRSDRAAALALWEQVRTGLLATVVAREANPASMRRLLYDRLLDRSGKVQSQSVRLDSAQTDRAFGAALSVAEFLRMGFKSDSGGMDVFYGPDADILLSDGFAAGYCFRIADRDPLARGERRGLGREPARRRQPRARFRPSEEEVLRHRERADQREVLKDDPDPRGARRARRSRRQRDAVERHGSGIGPKRAGDDAHQGRFAGAVLAEDAVDGARGEIEAHCGEGVARAVALVDAVKGETGGASRGGHKAAYGTATVRPRTASPRASTSRRTSGGMTVASPGLYTTVTVPSAIDSSIGRA